MVTVHRDGRSVDALAQTTKSGYVYSFDRTNGKPLFPIEYRTYPASTVPGERAAASQPLPTKPTPFARQYLTEDILTKRTPQAHEWALKQFRTFRSEGQFVPFGTDKPTVIFPGFDRGAEWGGPAVDPKSNVMYVNSTDIAWTGLLAKNTLWGQSNGQALYMNRCSVCHRDDRKGSPPDFPSLVEIGKRRSPKEIADVIVHGRGRMPPFSSLKDDELAAVMGYLINNENRQLAGSAKAREEETPYNFTGYHKFLDPDGYPAVEPPWGTLNALDLNTGNYLWKVPLGEYPELAAQGIKNTGTENYGGPIVTAGGLVFIASTIFDNKFRAFDTRSGKILWETTLPYSGRATPISYEVHGRQYVVIAATHPYDKKVGVYLAFALPKSRQVK